MSLSMNPTKIALNTNVNFLDGGQAEGIARYTILLSNVSMGDQSVTCPRVKLQQ